MMRPQAQRWPYGHGQTCVLTGTVRACPHSPEACTLLESVYEGILRRPGCWGVESEREERRRDEGVHPIRRRSLMLILTRWPTRGDGRRENRHIHIHVHTQSPLAGKNAARARTLHRHSSVVVVNCPVLGTRTSSVVAIQ